MPANTKNKNPPAKTQANVTAELDHRWAIRQDRVDAAIAGMISLQGMAMNRVQASEGEAPPLAMLHFADGSSRPFNPEAATVTDANFDQQQLSVGVIRLIGVVWSRIPRWYEEYGYVDPFRFADNVRKLAADPSVHSIVIEAQSPGGTVAGTEVAALAVMDAAKAKPVIFVVNDMACSAAIWIGSQATEIVLSGDSSLVGSIGVIMTHYDYTKFADEMGLKVTYLRSAERKALGQMFETMTDEIKADWKEELKLLHGKFVKAIQIGRKLSRAEASDLATGETWYGQDAISKRLADRIATLNSVINAQLKAIQTASGKNGRAEKPSGQGETMQEKEDPEPEGTAPGSETTSNTNANQTVITLELLQSQHPTLLSQIQTEAQASAAQAERTRIAGVLGVPLAEGQDLADQDLTVLSRQASEGRSYRDSLVAELHSEATRLYGSEKGIVQGKLLEEAFGHVSIDKLKQQVDLLKTQADAAIPDGRQSKDKQEQSTQKQIDWDKEA